MQRSCAGSARGIPDLIRNCIFDCAGSSPTVTANSGERSCVASSSPLSLPPSASPCWADEQAVRKSCLDLWQLSQKAGHLPSEPTKMTLYAHRWEPEPQYLNCVYTFKPKGGKRTYVHILHEPGVAVVTFAPVASFKIPSPFR